MNTSTRGGGAEGAAIALHKNLRERGHFSWLAVGQRTTEDPTVLAIPAHQLGPPAGVLARLAQRIQPHAYRNKLVGWTYRGLRIGASPGLLRDWWRGRERFDYPGTASLLQLPPERPDIVHGHNLHGGYFDLRELPRLSHERPVSLTLHDEWTFTGHCGYTMGLETWRSGCFSCPDLGVYPRMRRDSTHDNWQTKADIYAASRLYVITPSSWLMERAQASMLAPGAAAWRVIPNGVDRSVFYPGDLIKARAQLEIPTAARVILFVGNRIRRNVFKDPQTVIGAARQAAAALPNERLILIALGDAGAREVYGNLEVWSVPFEDNAVRVANYYRAADVYAHGAKSDNFPTTVLEALSTGTPVVATAVGGIPEQVRSLSGVPGGWAGDGYESAQATGALVPGEDPAAMGAAIVALLSHERSRSALSRNAASDAATRFDVKRQVDDTEAWYRAVIEDWTTWVSTGSRAPRGRVA